MTREIMPGNYKVEITFKLSKPTLETALDTMFEDAMDLDAIAIEEHDIGEYAPEEEGQEKKPKNHIGELVAKWNLFVGFYGHSYTVSWRDVYEHGTYEKIATINERGNVFYAGDSAKLHEEVQEVINHFAGQLKEAFLEKWEKLPLTEKWGMLHDKYAARKETCDLFFNHNMEEVVSQLEEKFLSE